MAADKVIFEGQGNFAVSLDEHPHEFFVAIATMSCDATGDDRTSGCVHCIWLFWNDNDGSAISV